MRQASSKRSLATLSSIPSYGPRGFACVSLHSRKISSTALIIPSHSSSSRAVYSSLPRSSALGRGEIPAEVVRSTRGATEKKGRLGWTPLGIILGGFLFETKPSQEIEDLYLKAVAMEDGNGVPEDVEGALFIYEKGIRAGHLPSYFRMALHLLRKEDATDKDIDRGMTLLYEAAEQKFEPAMWMMEMIFIFGPWIDPTLLEIIQGLEKTTEGLVWPTEERYNQGVPSQRELDANFHAEITKTIPMLEAYSKKRFPIANLLLGAIYEMGWGAGKPDLEKAKHYYTLAGEGAVKDVARVSNKAAQTKEK